jgi:murein DD-endopeptidase MepM/ murein hydrolase activator NlpD
MDKYYTIMVIPEKAKGVKSIRIPVNIVRSFSFFGALTLILLGIFAYDYWKILQQVYENKHLTLENRQLKEQIQLFQLKMNALSDDLTRINLFERKLRVITGLENQKIEDSKPFLDSSAPLNLDFSRFEDDPQFQELKINYDKKIAASLGLEKSYTITKEWSDLARRSFALSADYARFDLQYLKIKDVISAIEDNINKLDQHLLDKSSFLNSTPTLLPAQGWITSYFGQRISPYSGKLKMHEGIDVGAPYGTPIFSPADGVVTYSGEKAGFGKFVQVDHGYGIETIYAHSQALFVKSGERIKRGVKLAAVGNTGHSTGPHLHYEVRVNGIAVDPLYFILD